MYKIKVKKIKEDAMLPKKGRPEDACYDLYTSEETFVGIGQTVVVPTGISMEMPLNLEAEIRPRSGISLRGVPCETEYGYMTNADCLVIQGTIEPEYRGEIGIIFKNLSRCDIRIPKHTRLAQMKINEILDTTIEEVEELSNSNRGTAGYGSSGVN